MLAGPSTDEPVASTSTFLPLGEGIEGDMPRDVTLTLDGLTAIVVCRDTDTIEWYDALSGARLDHTPVGERPLDVALSVDGQLAFVACSADDNVVVIDVATRQVIHTYSVPGHPHRIVATPDGTRLIVGCDTGGNVGRFAILDLASGQLTHTFSTPYQGPIAYTLAPWSGVRFDYYPDFDVTPDSTTIVFADAWGSSIRLYDTATGGLVKTFGVGTLIPGQVDISRSGSFAAVSCMDSLGGNHGQVVAIDLGSLTQSSLGIGTGVYLSVLRITPDEASILIGTYTGVDVIDVATGNTVGSLPGGFALGSIEFTHDDAYAIAAFWDAVIVDLASMTVVSRIPASAMQMVAVSPSAHHAVALSPSFDERLVAFSTAGTASQLSWSTPLGVPVEIDGPYAVELMADGREAVVACPVSNNLVRVDIDSRQQLRTIPTSAPSHSFAVDPKGNFVVAALEEAGRVAVIDIASGQTLAELTVSGRARKVVLSPDGARAFVLINDGLQSALAFIDISGAGSMVSSELTFSGTWLQSMALAPDGTILALAEVGGSVMLVDVASESIVANLQTTGAILGPPVWSADSTHLAWALGVGDLAIAKIDGANSSVQVLPGSSPVAGVAFDESAQFAYILLKSSSVDLTLRVIDITTLGVATEVPLTGTLSEDHFFPHWLIPVADQLLIVRTSGGAYLWRTSMAGASSSLLETIQLPEEGTHSVAVSTTLGRLVLPASFEGDGLRLIEFGGNWESYCGPAAPNSTGVGGELTASGTLLAGAQPFRLEATQLPTQTFGMFLVADAMNSIQPPGSQGTLCLGGMIARFADEVQNTGAAGAMTLDVDLEALPFSPPVTVAPGQVWYFQAWFRDHNPGATSNFTNGVRASFR